MNKIVTTTTNNIEGWSIKEYLQPISANVVIGSNVLSEFSASFSDFFGGRSGTYERKLQLLYDQSLQQLKKKARSLGANCVVGVKIDIDEISGKGQMFMITAYGTPVKASRSGDLSKELFSDDLVDGSYIENKVKAKKLIERFKDQSRLTDEDIQFVIDNPYPEFKDTVLTALRSLTVDAQVDQIKTRIIDLAKYFAVLPTEMAIEILYDELAEEGHFNYHSRIFTTIKKYGLVDYNKVRTLMTHPTLVAKKFALLIISIEKPYYSKLDIAELKALQTEIPEVFQPIVDFTTKKSLLSSSEKEIWICSCGSKNGVKSLYCDSCKNDTFGFKQEEFKSVAAVQLIEDRLEFLE